ncbi:Protein of unknown function [Austwickia chelonae]|uniref:DUF3515 family protein n=1 Tax=Austwickia chelonae TaxID=100225 RepID=UPI0008C4F2F1|nr:DUF3515 family protein [Austwickia chelonae]SEW27651.1 Protein of unknown function [Austwickia chelonae]
MFLLAAGYWFSAGRGPTVSPAEHASDESCLQVAEHWPRQVAGQDRRAVRGNPTAAAAWGEPMIIARCGVNSPGPTTDDCIAADGVDWVGRRLTDGMAFVTYGRTPAIEILVPHEYAPEPLLLGAFAGAAAKIPQGPHTCR